LTDANSANVLVRHLSGDTAGEAESFSVSGRSQISFGREPGQDVVFDGELAVAPRHALIRIVGGDKPIFRLEDAESGRGVYLNGVRLSQPTELLPEDEIALGEGGPRLLFDLSPRPAHVGARQRLDAPPAIEIPATPSAAAEPPPVVPSEIAGPVGAPPEPTRADWTSAFVVLAGLAAVGLGGLMWRQSGRAPAPAESAPTSVETNAPQVAPAPPSALAPAAASLIPEEIAQRHASATALVLTHWRVYDKETGKPVFVKTFRQDNIVRPVFVELPNRTVVPWLTLDDERQANLPASGVESGTAFAVSPQGRLLTSKSVAAGWTNPYGACHCREDKGWLVHFGDSIVDGRLLRLAGKKLLRAQATPIDLATPAAGEAFLEWVPARGGHVLDALYARYLTEKGHALGAVADERAFVGKNESIDVIFPHAEGAIKGVLAKTSETADVALIETSPARPLPAVTLATALVAAGEKLVVLGYPTDDAPTFSRSGVGSQDEAAALGEAAPRASEVEARSADAETIALARGSRNPGDRGGPVFNAKGEVVGVYAPGLPAATPIEFGHELLREQDTGK
jgi:hypothetical protein